LTDYNIQDVDSINNCMNIVYLHSYLLVKDNPRNEWRGWLI